MMTVVIKSEYVTTCLR